MRRGPGKRKKNAKDFAADVQRVDRQTQALDLRVEGLTIRAIAKKLNISVAQADRDVKQAIADRPNETADQMRARANEALEIILAGHLPAARGHAGSDDVEAGASSEKSAQVVIKAIALHAKINGYEAAERHEVTGPGGGPILHHDVTKLTDAELEALVRGEPVGGAASEGGAGAKAESPQ